MATEKQILANRQNAKRSTGPRTAAGKAISSRNAFRHGLSRSLERDELKQHSIEILASAIAGTSDGKRRNAAIAIAAAHLEIERVRNVRTEIINNIDLATATSKELWRLNAIDRYETRARTDRRRASAKFRDSSP